MKRYCSPEEQAARDTRRAAFRKMAKQVADMSPEARAALAQRIPVANVEGHTLSLHNQCLIALQCPTATLVGGFAQWIRAGRAVRKDEHGYMIWVPLKPREDPNKRDGETSSAEELRFMPGTVFDVSQTQEIETGRGEDRKEHVAPIPQAAPEEHFHEMFRG